MNRNFYRRAPGFALALAIGLAWFARTPALYAEPSDSDMAQARELLKDGLRLREQGDPGAALDRLRGAHALAHTPITGLELARDYLALGKLVEARETFLSVARIPPRTDETSRSAAARSECESQARALRDRIPTLTVRVTGVPMETVSVAIDGAAVPTEALLAPRLLNPGTHAVTARSTAGGTAETTVDVKQHEAREIELKIAFSPAPAPATPAPGRANSAPAASVAPLAEAPPVSTPRSHVLGWSLIGVGAALAIGGGVLMGVEPGQAHDAIQRQDHPAYDAARATWTVSLVGTISGGALVATGAILLVTTAGGKSSGRGPAPFWIGAGPTGVICGGSW